MAGPERGLAGWALSTVLLNPVLQLVRADTTRSVKFDRGQPTLEQVIHFDLAHAKHIGDLSHLEQLLHFCGPSWRLDLRKSSRFSRLLGTRFSSHNRFLLLIRAC